MRGLVTPNGTAVVVVCVTRRSNRPGICPVPIAIGRPGALVRPLADPGASQACRVPRAKRFGSAVFAIKVREGFITIAV
jgi:hypothetical protein